MCYLISLGARRAPRGALCVIVINTIILSHKRTTHYGSSAAGFVSSSPSLIDLVSSADALALASVPISVTNVPIFTRAASSSALVDSKSSFKVSQFALKTCSATTSAPFRIPSSASRRADDDSTALTLSANDAFSIFANANFSETSLNCFLCCASALFAAGASIFSWATSLAEA